MDENNEKKHYLGAEGLIRLVANIMNKFVTKDEMESKANEIQSSIEDTVESITSGDVVVKEAEHATSADSATTAGSATNAEHATNADTATSAGTAESATKAVQDAEGNIITETYETKADADETEAALTALIDAKADEDHVHDVATAEADGFMSAADKAKLDNIDISSFTISLTVDENEDGFITGGNVESLQGVEF